MGGYFQFFTKNRPQNHQKGAILRTSQRYWSYPRTQQRNQGTYGLNPNHAIRVVVKATPLPSWLRCCSVTSSFDLLMCNKYIFDVL